MAHPSGMAHRLPNVIPNTRRKLVIHYDESGFGGVGEIKTDLLTILETMLPYLVDNVEIIESERDDE